MLSVNFSGAAFSIPKHLGVIEVLLEKDLSKLKVVSGVSSGALVTLPFVMSINNKNFYEKFKEIILNFTLEDVFGEDSPVDDKGKLSFKAYKNIIQGKPYLGKMSGLKNLIKKLITKEVYIKYQNGKYPEIVISACTINGEIKYWKLKENKVTYEEYIDCIIASSTIPVFCEPKRIDNVDYIDGGVRSHLLTEYVINNYNCKDNISVFSRSENISLEHKIEFDNIVESLERSNNILIYEVSKSDSDISKLLAHKLGLNLIEIYVGGRQSGLWDCDKQLLLDKYLEGLKQGRLKL